MENDDIKLKRMVYAALMAALTAAGAYIAIPVGPVPIVLQNMFVMLTGLLLGRRWAGISIGVYLLAGAAGLPIFAGGAGGIGRFAGPTGGYLVGYWIAAWLIGLISEKGRRRIMIDVLAMICGMLVIYAFGVSWLKIITGMSVSKAVAAGMLPFLVGDAIKIVAAVLIARALRPMVHETFQAVRVAG